MSGQFDELARRLAAPMGRRSALRLVASTVALTAFPVLRPSSAAAAGAATCPSGTEVCTNGKGSQVCMPAGGNCCIFPGLIVGCPPGFSCDEKLIEKCRCNGTDCGGGLKRRCCPKGKSCEDGKCVSCESERKCGKACCKEGEECISEVHSQCCPRGARYCAVFGSAGTGQEAKKVICCPPGAKCCANDVRASCCTESQTCQAGTCSCPKNTRRCGSDCCKPGEVCSNGKCCPKGKVNCGGKCCDKDECCGTDFKTCCAGNTICLNGTCCPLNRGVGSGKKARCCPPGTMPTPTGTCCPKNDPECCTDSDGEGNDLSVLCKGGRVCVEGVCREL